MKNILKYIIFIMLLTLPAQLRADFDDTGAGARARAMGNSYTAIADDVFGMYYNPAGLGFIQTSQFAADAGKLYSGLTDNSNMLSGFTGIAFPITKIKTTVSLTTSSAPVSGISSQPSSIMTRTTSYKHYGAIGFGVRAFTLENYYTESMYYLSYGMPVNNKWAWGASVKLLNEGYILDQYMMQSPVFNNGNKSTVSNMSFDAGVIYIIAPRFYAGLSLLDINQPDLGLLYEDKLPATLRTGVAWREKGLSWALDAVYSRNEWIYSTGFEKYIGEIFGVRAGVGYGGMQYFNVSAGFSVRVARAQLDYSFEYPVTGIQNTSGTNRLSLSFKFGMKKKEELEAGSLEFYYSKAKDEVALLSQQLSETKTEKDNLEKILVEESTLRIREKIKAAKIEARGTPQASSASSLQYESKESKGVRHIVRDGETLQSVAQKYFGDEKYWNEIYQANKDTIGRGGALKVNQVLNIPTAAHTDTPTQATQVSSQASQGPVIKTISQTLSGNAGNALPIVKEIIPIKIIQEAGEQSTQTKPAETKKQSSDKTSVSKPRKHIVQQGENLRSIAQKYYNDSDKWKLIYKANKDKIISGQVNPGQEITIP